MELQIWQGMLTRITAAMQPCRRFDSALEPSRHCQFAHFMLQCLQPGKAASMPASTDIIPCYIKSGWARMGTAACMYQKLPASSTAIHRHARSWRLVSAKLVKHMWWVSFILLSECICELHSECTSPW